ncbi:MAG: hypothetical protein IKK67_04525 [Bacteroidaceae bacterium]|nr:hypothetical protein [Bacteroidaceae bacterium]
MLQINLKRKQGNKSVVFGVLSIPKYGFKCVTMEMAPATSDMMYKHSCGIPEGNYTLTPGFSQGYPMFPLFEKKPLGFAVKPKFNLTDMHYNSLPTGDIAIGKAVDGDFALQGSGALNLAFADIFKHFFAENPGEIVVITIYKSKNFVYTEMSYQDVLLEDANRNFIEDDFDDEEQTELEDNNDGQ